VVKERLAEEVVEQVDLGFVRLEYVPVVAERAEHDLVRLMAGLERIEDEQSGERRLTMPAGPAMTQTDSRSRIARAFSKACVCTYGGSMLRMSASKAALRWYERALSARRSAPALAIHNFTWRCPTSG
jgi:hypothetical protein